MSAFHSPFFYNPNYYKPYYDKKYDKTVSHQNNSGSKAHIPSNANLQNASNEITSSDEPYFFELFGLKLYFDDVLLVSLLFFLYTEDVKDDELFISLVLLLLS